MAVFRTPNPLRRGAAQHSFPSAFAIALGAACLMHLPAAAALAQDQPVRITTSDGQPAHSSVELTIGLTPHGDGSSCGSDTEVAVEVGVVVDVCYTVTNRSGTDFAYATLDDSVDGNIFRYLPAALPAGGTYVHHRQVRARSSQAITATWSVQDRAPGYLFDDGAPAAFVDIRSSGTRLDVLDAPLSTAVIQLPFDVPFYGVPTRTFCALNFGMMYAGLSDCSRLVSLNLPLQYFTRNMVAPFWDNLTELSGGVYWQVLGSAPNRSLVVQWDRPHQWCDLVSDQCFETPARADVEAILGEDGSISFQYRSTSFDHIDWISGLAPYDHGRSATIGLRYHETSSNQSFVHAYSHETELPNPDPSAITWTPIPMTRLSAQASVGIDAGAPRIQVTPASIAATADTTPVTTRLAIANTGDRALDWTLAQAHSATGDVPAARPSGRATVAVGEERRHRALAASQAALRGDPVQRSAAMQPSLSAGVGIAPPAPGVVTNGAECGDTVPGVVFHDDGSAINGYAGARHAQAVAVDRFTPTYYPASFASVCVAFTTWAYPVAPAGTVHFDVVVYDDTGTGGGPGNELGRVAATTHGTPYPDRVVFKDRVDISGLGLALDSGSVYIGVRWDADQADGYKIYLGADENGSDGLPMNLPEAGYFDIGDGVFVPTTDYFPEYVAMMIRAVETAPGCANTAAVPWLSVTPTTGHVAAGAAASMPTVTLDPSGLADGVHEARLCVDGGKQSVAVPVRFTVGTDAIFADGFERH